MRRAFVADGESPASGANRSSLLVAPVRNRTRTRDNNHAGACVKRCFECDFIVADDVYGRGENLGQNLADHPGKFRTPRSRATQTRAFDLLRCDPGRGAHLLYRPVQRVSDLCFADSNDVAGASRGCGKQRPLISDRTRRLCAAAINANVVAHEIFLTHADSRLGTLDRERLQRLTREKRLLPR